MNFEEQLDFVNDLVERYGLSKFGESSDGVSLFFDDDAEQYMEDVMDQLYSMNIDFDEDGKSHLYVRWMP